MKITMDGNIYIALSSYDERAIPKDAGFRWDAAKRRWWTGDTANAVKLIQYADDAATKALGEYQAHREKAIGESRAADADIAIPCPEGLSYLPFQRAGIAYGKDRKSVLLSDEMGLGKTIQAIGLINLDETLRKILVVCPASLKINWKRELEKWLIRPYSIAIISASDNPPANADIIIINYDILKKHAWLHDVQWDIMIADEIHYCKSFKTIRSKEVYELAKKAKRKIFLTGTPIVNRPSELFGIISALGFPTGGWYTYMTRYCAAYKTRWGWDVSGASHLDELQEKLRMSIMVRRLKKDVLSELPPKRRQIIELPANGMKGQVSKESSYMQEYEEQRQEIRALRDLAKASDDDSAYQAAVEKLRDFEQAAFTEMSKLRHETALAKVPYAIEHIKELLESTEKLVVFAHHHDVISEIANSIGVPYVTLTGNTSQEERQKSVDAFQNNPDIKVFIGSITAAGVGITLTAASTVVFVELDWVPGNMSQGEDRCHRIGQANSVLVQHLVIDGSIDAKLAKTIVAKQATIDSALDVEKKDTIDLSTAGSLISEPAEESIEQSTSPEYTQDEKDNLTEVIRQVARYCDGAFAQDGMGFNRYDACIGKSFAEKGIHTNKQATLAKKIIRKYKRQIEEELYNNIFEKGE